MLKSATLVSESFVFVFIMLNWVSVPWGSDLLFGDAAALTMASLCSAQAVFRIQPQRDVYSECWSHPLAPRLSLCPVDGSVAQIEQNSP